MADPSSAPTGVGFQRYHVLSSDEDDFDEDGGNVVLMSPSSELGGLVTNASMHSTGGHSASSSPDRLPRSQQPQQQQQQQLPSSHTPVKSFEEGTSVASSSRSAASGGGGYSLRTGNSASLPNSPLNSLTKSASHGDSDDDDDDDPNIDDDGSGDGAREGAGRDAGGGGGIGKMTWDDDDLSDDDDEAGLRRYHFTQANTLPAEFDNASTWKRITSYVLEVRMAARQRRAHRLLSMSGTHMDSPAQRCRLCFMTHCWDATDRGILLLIVSVFAWLVIGFVLHPGERYWYVGLVLLVVRLGARPAYEAIVWRRPPFAMPATSSAVPRAPSAAAGGFGRIASSSLAASESLELGSSSHHRRPGRSRSPSPKPRGMV